MKKEFVLAGLVVLVAFIVNYALLWYVDYIVSFWSLGVLAVVLLIVGAVSPQREGGETH